MSILERLPMEEMNLSGAFESSCMARASGVTAAELAEDDEQVSLSGHLFRRAYHES
jgi:uncharacterized protein YdeI (BOF family)